VVSLYANERDNCLVADRDGEVVGFALGSILEKRGEPWTFGYPLWLGVDPERTRRGLRHRVIEALGGPGRAPAAGAAVARPRRHGGGGGRGARLRRLLPAGLSDPYRSGSTLLPPAALAR
jgi:hypothetical protein